MNSPAVSQPIDMTQSENAKGLLEYMRSGPIGILPREEHVKRAYGAIGLGYRTKRSYKVGREKLRDLATAVHANHPIHYSLDYAERQGSSKLIASPTFVGILGIIAQRPLTEGFVVGYDISQIMQTEQRLEYLGPIYEDDELWIDVIFESFREIAGADIMVIRNEVHNQRNECVVSSWTTIVARIVDEVNKEAEDYMKGVMLSEREVR